MPGNQRYYDSNISLGDEANQSFLEAPPASSPNPRRWKDYWTCVHYLWARRTPNIVEAAPIFLRDVRRISYLIAATGLSIIGLACCYGWAQADSLKVTRDDLFGDPNDWAACIEDDWKCCLYFVPAQALTINNFAADASTVGIYSVVFAGLGAAVAYRAFKHYEWLPSSIAMLIYAQVCILSYYTSDIIIPTPQNLTSSLAIMTRYVHSKPYDGVGASLGVEVDDQCHVAQQVNTAYICLQYVLVGCLFALLLICLGGEYVRRCSPKRHRYPQLAHTLVPRLLAVFIILCYAAGTIGRSIVAFTAAGQFQDRSEEIPQAFPATTYPFITASLDVATILLASGAMAVIRGNTRQSVSALRVSALTSLFYVVLLFPTILGNLYSAVIFDLLGSGSSCKNFFDINYGVNGAGFVKLWGGIFPWAYPGSTDTDAQAALCAATRTSILASFSVFLLQILQCGFSGYAYLVNQHRQSEILDYSYPHLSSPMPFAAEPEGSGDAETVYKPPRPAYGDSLLSQGDAYDT